MRGENMKLIDVRQAKVCNIYKKEIFIVF